MVENTQFSLSVFDLRAVENPVEMWIKDIANRYELCPFLINTFILGHETEIW